MDKEIERQHFSGNELLKKGTSVLFNSHKILSPLLAKETKENDLKISCQAASVNSANMQRDYSRYAMEGPHTTNISTPTYPRKEKCLTNKDRICVGNLEKEEREPSFNIRSAPPTHTNSLHGNLKNNSLKLESKASLGRAWVRQKSASISSSNEVERSLVKLKSCPPDNSKQDSDDIISGICVELSVRSHVVPEKLNEIPSRWKSNILNTKRAKDDDRFTHTATSMTMGFDSDNPLSIDKTNSSARTRVYHRKTNSRKQQSDLPPEKKIRKLCHDTTGQSGHQEQVSTPVVGQSLSSQRKVKKVCVTPHP